VSNEFQRASDFLMGCKGLCNLDFLCSKDQFSLNREEWIVVIKAVIQNNPLLKLDAKSLLEVFEMPSSQVLELSKLSDSLSLSRQASMHINNKSLLISAMPKSGSSFFVQLLSQGLDANFVSLTGTSTRSSLQGANGREQELDELALCKNVLSMKRFVAQHHMKGTPFLTNLLSNYSIQTIVLTRNIFDQLVSVDDMNMSNPGWLEPFAQWSMKLPIHYNQLEKQERLEYIAYKVGVWCIDFYLSWVRLKKQGSQHFVVPYERYLSNNSGDKKLLINDLKSYLQLDDKESQKLLALIATDTISQEESRFNKGVSGRGDEVPEQAKKFLLKQAKLYKDELTDEDMYLLFGL